MHTCIWRTESLLCIWQILHMTDQFSWSHWVCHIRVHLYSSEVNLQLPCNISWITIMANKWWQSSKDYGDSFSRLIDIKIDNFFSNNLAKSFGPIDSAHVNYTPIEILLLTLHYTGILQNLLHCRQRAWMWAKYSIRKIPSGGARDRRTDRHWGAAGGSFQLK